MTSVFQKAQQSGGIVILRESSCSNYAVTHPDTYNYLPTDIEAMKTTRQTEAGVSMVYRTEHVMENIMKWFVLCTLEKNCIAPISQRHCSFKKDDWFNTFAECHRYDQAVVNILLANYYNYDRSQYSLHDQKVVSIIRGESFPQGQKLDICE